MPLISTRKFLQIFRSQGRILDLILLNKMTDNTSKVYEESSMAAAPKQRKKRKWDQPAESFISAGLTLSGVGSLGGLAIPVPGVSSLTGPLLTSPVPVTCSTTTQAFQVLSNQQSVSTILQKLNLPKMQDELVAREIVINDAESTVRYKLTKRQTQEEIQRCTGAVVITRGKYRPPNALPDNEKPLYLHISAGSHLKEMAERIIAVDQAAAMVEEMLKQGQSPNLTTTPYHSAINVGGQVSHLLSACVFLGFNTNSSLNIGARIRGPNDQYINHIMNETGASVVLRGQGLENSNRVDGEELSQPLYLFLSAKSLKSLEDAKLLAENLLDTVAAECGASRATSSKVYKAVPPPPQLLSGGVNSASVDTMASLSMDSSLQVGVSRPGYGQPQRNPVCYQPQTSVCGTSYNGYGGIYPQTTPLQQVALVLSQSPSPVTSFTAPANTSEHAKTTSIAETGKRPLQKRKFQELPVSSKLAAETHQNSLQRPEFVKPGPVYEDSSSRNNTITMLPPKKLAGMPPPPPLSMPPPPSKLMPPPPPKLMSAALSSKSQPPPSSVPDTLFKLMEYGDDDDDDPEEESENSKLKLVGAPKPFWAL